MKAKVDANAEEAITPEKKPAPKSEPGYVKQKDLDAVADGK